MPEIVSTCRVTLYTGGESITVRYRPGQEHEALDSLRRQIDAGEVPFSYDDLALIEYQMYSGYATRIESEAPSFDGTLPRFW